MTVYIEYVLINNFIIDYLLLRLTFILTGKKVKTFRLILLSILGACFSLVFPLINLGKLYLSVIKLLFGTLLVLISAKFNTKKEFFINLGVFFFVTVLLGGAVFAVYFAVGVTNFAEIYVALCFIPVWLLSVILKKAVLFLYRRKNVESVIYPFEFTLCGEKFIGRGFLDTGNALYYNDKPVVVCEMSFVKKIFKGQEVYKRLQKIKIHSASGSSEKFCINLEELKIFIKDKQYIYSNAVLMIARINITGADLLLHPALLEGVYEGKDNREVKKVS